MSFNMVSGASFRRADLATSSMPAQQHNLPRFVEVGKENGRHTVEILQYGTVMPFELWSTKEAIFPKGFRSRVRYWSVVEPNKLCVYNSEILDAELASPIFMVSIEGNPSEMFAHITPKRCWDLVLEKVNKININFYQENKKRGRPRNYFPVQKLGSIDGLEMFGLCDPTVIQDLEGLDIERQSKFCRIKDLVEEEGEGDPEVQHQNPLERRVAPNPLDDNTKRVFQELLKKLSPEELGVFQTVFQGVWSSTKIRQQVTLAFHNAEMIRSRQP